MLSNFLPNSINKWFHKEMEKNKMHLTFKEPNFDFEWNEAIRYPEFERLGKKQWISLVKLGCKVMITSVKNVNNTDAYDPNLFDTLDKDKQKRALIQIESGYVEMPIIAFYSDGRKELISGNTRLTAMMKRYGESVVWRFDVPDFVLTEKN